MTEDQYCFVGTAYTYSMDAFLHDCSLLWLTNYTLPKHLHALLDNRCSKKSKHWPKQARISDSGKYSMSSNRPHLDPKFEGIMPQPVNKYCSMHTASFTYLSSHCITPYFLPQCAIPNTQRRIILCEVDQTTHVV